MAAVVILMIGAYPLIRMNDLSIAKAVTAGFMIALLNVILGYAAIEYSIGKSTVTFFKYVIGGMGLRMLLLSIVLVALIKIFLFPVLALVGSLGIFYIVFLVLEIMYIQKKVEIKQQS